MAAFDSLLTSAGQDKFLEFYTKYNDTMTALKAGTTAQMLIGNGGGSAPAMQSAWSAFVVVGSGGGAPGFSANFQATGTSSDRLRFRKSLVLDTIEVVGRFDRITSTIPDGSAVTIFVLPAGHLPGRPIMGVAKGSNNKLLTLIFDNVSGNVSIVNNTGTAIPISDFLDLNIRFSIS